MQMLGPVYRIKAALFRKDIVVISDSVAVRHIINDVYTYGKAPVWSSIAYKALGRGLVWAQGDEHKIQRRLVAPAFTSSAVKAMIPGIQAIVEKTMLRIMTDIEAEGQSATLNMMHYISPCMFEIIGSVGFGRDLGYNTPESKAVFVGWHADVEFSASFAGFIAPILIEIFPWISKLPIKKLQEDGITKQIIHKFGRELIKQYRETGEIAGDENSIFSILMRDAWQGSGKAGATMNDETLLDNIVTFLVVGFETTSAVIQLTLLDLAKSPSKQTKLRQELLNADSDSETLESLLYLDAVTREGLRLHPTARDTERVALKVDALPLGDPLTLSDGAVIQSIPVKAGDVFQIPFSMANRNPDVWGPDANSFEPERWLSDALPRERLPTGPFSNTSTFLDGPRHCIGWRLAVVEIKLVVASMVKLFELREAPGVEVKTFAAPNIQPFVDGIPNRMPLLIRPLHV